MMSDTQPSTPNDFEENGDKPAHGKPDTSAHSTQFRQALNESARLLRDNRPGEAVRILESLRKAHPDDPDVAINLGGALILQRKWKRAVAVLEPATRSHPHNAMLWTNLGAAYLGSLETAGPRQQDNAIAAYEQALQVDPQAPNVHYHLGLIHKERGHLKRASAHFQRALEVNPTDRDARYWLDRLGRIMAEEQYQRRQDANDEKDNGA